jgi:site-specific DNA recombinase
LDVHSDRIDIGLSGQRLAKLLAGQSIDLTMPNQNLDRASSAAVILTAPARLKRVGREMRMLVDGSDDQRAADPSLLRIIVRAHDVQGRLSQNTKLTVHDIAREEGVTAAYLFNLLRLPWLAPDITTAIINGRQPRQLTAMTLMRKASQLPADWVAQRSLLGF